VKPLVLIAEDEPAQVEMLRYNLESAGYRTIAAGDGAEALRRIEEAEPDLVILDWMLPKVSGIEVCRQLRSREATHRLPILMVTALSEEPDRAHAFETGVDDYLVKPFSPAEMMARVRTLLQRASRPDGDK